MRAFKIENGSIYPSQEEDACIFIYSVTDEQSKQNVFNSLRYDRTDLESSLDPDEVPRIDHDEGVTTLIVKTPKRADIQGSIRFEVSSVGIFLEGRRVNFVTTNGNVDFASKVFQGVSTVTDVVLRYLMSVARHFIHHLRAIKMIKSEIQSKLNTSMENKYLLQMFALGESLVYYVESLEANGSVLSRMRRGADRFKLAESQVDYLTEILLENQQSAKQADIYSNVLSGLMDARGNIINNNVNALLRKLTLINVVFLPLNLLASIGGMSEFSMMTQGIDWRLSYLGFSVGMLALGWLTWAFLVRTIDKPPHSRSD